MKSSISTRLSTRPRPTDASMLIHSSMLFELDARGPLQNREGRGERTYFDIPTRALQNHGDNSRRIPALKQATHFRNFVGSRSNFGRTQPNHAQSVRTSERGGRRLQEGKAVRFFFPVSCDPSITRRLQTLYTSHKHI